MTTLDRDPRFEADYALDILQVHDLAELEGDRGPFHLIVASPPCEGFSVMTIGRYWRRLTSGAVEPKHPTAALAVRIARHVFDLIDRYRPAFYIIENPRGMLRRVAPRPPTVTTWYCQWGRPYAKPTDLWTNLECSPRWPTCSNGAPDHERASRGQVARRLGLRVGGIQGMGNASSHRNVAAARSVIPESLARAVGLAVLNGGTVHAPPQDQVALPLTETASNPVAHGYPVRSGGPGCRLCHMPTRKPRRGPRPEFCPRCLALGRDLRRARSRARVAGATEVLRHLSAAIAAYLAR